ncbi:MAG: hypothetical protein WC700_09165 [Gemmatimonadaceae bacterium]
MTQPMILAPVRKALGVVVDDVTGAARSAIHNLAHGGHGSYTSRVATNVARLGMSERQRQLDWRWQVFCGCHYDGRKYDWDGRKAISRLDEEAVGSRPADMGGGFVDNNNSMADANVPLRARKPSAPYHLANEIVERFTAKLFSERNHPTLSVSYNPEAEDWVHTIIEQGRLWAKMREARNLGGGMGCVPVGFEFRDGQIVFEVHDPRWMTPIWRDKGRLDLAAVETRWMDRAEVRVWDPKAHQYYFVEKWFWYRRVIDDSRDVIYQPVPVSESLDAPEPQWVEDKVVEHDFGFVPVVWIQNEPVHDDPDGSPDCALVYDECRAIDTLMSQAVRGTIANCDPTFWRKDKVPPTDTLQKGSGAGVDLTEAGAVGYLELTGSGPKLAMELVEQLRQQVLEVVRCVIESGGAGDKAGPPTATEIRRRYDSMESRIDGFREQYGQTGVLPLIRLVLSAAQKIAARPPRTEVVDEETGETREVRDGIILPRKAVVDAATGAVQWLPRLVPSADEPLELALKWPPYERPSLTDTKDAVTAAGLALTSKVLDIEAAIRFVAPFFGIDDAGALHKKLEAAAAAEREAQEQAAMSGMGGGGGGY